MDASGDVYGQSRGLGAGMSQYILKINKDKAFDDKRLAGGVFVDGEFLDFVNGYTEAELILAAKVVMQSDIELNSADGKTIVLN
jgi:hypothetical protein